MNNERIPSEPREKFPGLALLQEKLQGLEAKAGTAPAGEAVRDPRPRAARYFITLNSTNNTADMMALTSALNSVGFDLATFAIPTDPEQDREVESLFDALLGTEEEGAKTTVAKALVTRVLKLQDEFGQAEDAKARQKR